MFRCDVRIPNVIWFLGLRKFWKWDILCFRCSFEYDSVALFLGMGMGVSLSWKELLRVEILGVVEVAVFSHESNGGAVMFYKLRD